MKVKKIVILLIGLFLLGGLGFLYANYHDYLNLLYFFEKMPETRPTEGGIKLPEPKTRGAISTEEALAKRRSVRDYATEKALSMEEVSQLLWSAQGITEPFMGKRTAPSAGATYPMEIYLMARKVDGLKEGVYRYYPDGHSLFLIKEGDFSRGLEEVCLGQYWVGDGVINIVITAVFERTTTRYGKRGERYVHMEAGHIGQNVYLQAEVLNLGTVVVGAFHDDKIREVLSLPEGHIPLYVMPVGKKR